MERRYANEIVGYNARMTDLHAAIGRVQLRRLPEWTAHPPAQRGVPRARVWTARRASTGWWCRAVAPAAEPVWHQYTVRVPDRDRLVAHPGRLGVRTGVYYPTPIHRLPAYGLDLDLPQTAARRRARCCPCRCTRR